MNEKQISAIRCAYADLVGIYQTIIRDGSGSADTHDWHAHRSSIYEMEDAFPDIIEPVSLEG